MSCLDVCGQLLDHSALLHDIFMIQQNPLVPHLAENLSGAMLRCVQRDRLNKTTRVASSTVTDP